MNDRLYRSRDDRMLAGVAGGLADLWDADPSLVRIVWALLVIFTGGIALVAYIIMAIVVPEGDPMPRTPAATGPTPGSSADPGPMAFTAEGAATSGPAPAAAPTPPAAGSGWNTPSATDARRAARRSARAERHATRRAGDGVPGKVVGGIALILVGVFFLAREFLPDVDFDWFWPLALVGLGVVLLVSALARGRDDDGSA